MPSRVYPVTHGEWSWWIPVIFIGICLFIALIGRVKELLEDKPWWNALLVAGMTLFSALVLTARARDGDFEYFIVMLIPSFAAIGSLYVALIGILDHRSATR